MFENFEKIKKALEDNRFDVIAELEDRLLVRVPLNELTVLNSLKGVRAGDPNRELLTKSIERTEQPIYPIACFGDFDDGEFSLAVVDGHQRKAVLESQGGNRNDRPGFSLVDRRGGPAIRCRSRFLGQ